MNNPLWQYSLAVYPRPGFEALLLRLQDQCGADINLLLSCCYLAQQGRRLSPAAVDSLCQTVETWQRQCVQPLRQVRRALKGRPQPEGFRQQVKALELQAEQYQQQQLWQCLTALALAPAPADSALLAANLACYRQLLPEALQAPAADLMAQLVAALAD